MAIKINVASQKGGTGKSTLARLIGTAFAAIGWNSKIADLDTSQGTSFQWRSRRLENKIEPDVPVEQFGQVEKALKIADQYDLLIFDGAPHSTQATRTAALASDLTIIPTGLSRDDLHPSVVLAHDLFKSGTPRERIVFALCRVNDSEAEIREARTYLTQAGYEVLPGALPQRTGYSRASDEGRALTETRHPSLNRHAEEMAQAIVNKIQELTAAIQPDQQEQRSTA